MASVTLKNLIKRFGKVTAVNDVSLEIRDGEFIILLGPSGCGKSTMLYSIAGLEDISGGEIYIGERLMNRVPPKARNIAMVFQDYALYPHMNVYDNMAFGLKLRKARQRRSTGACSEAAGLLGIEPPAAAPPARAVGRPAPARGAGPRHRARAGRLPDGRAALQPGRHLARADARRDLQAAQQAQDDVHLRHARPGRGDDHGRPHRHPQGRRDPAGRHARRRSTTSPANVFVAGFIGTPSMNFMQGTLRAQDGRLALDTGSFRVPIAPGSLPADRHLETRVVGGIRPSSIRLLARGEARPEEGAVIARVEVVEPMGDIAYIYVDAGGVPMSVRVDPLRLPEAGSEVTLVIDGAALHLFDAASQRAIAHAGSAETLPAVGKR